MSRSGKGGNKSLKGDTKGFGLLSHFELGAPRACAALHVFIRGLCNLG
jgi:hypothetical protein